MPLPRREIGAMVDDTLSRFALRKLVTLSGQHVVVPTDQAEVIAYYADTISHHFDT
jgi:glycerol-3-phosphate O-acyltransferase